MDSVLRRFKNNKKKIYLLIIGLNISIILSLISLNNISDKFATYNYQITYSITDLKYTTTQAHLWLEEYMNGDESEIVNVEKAMNESKKTLNDLLFGGIINNMKYDSTLNDNTTHNQLLAIRAKLNNFEKLSYERMESYSPLDFYSDSLFDAKFRDLIDEISILSIYTNSKFKNMYEKYIFNRNLIYLSILVLVLIALYLVRRLNSEIENNIKTIQNQSLELKDLNTSLEKRVENEVNSNIKKEKQIFQQRKILEMNDLLINIGHHWRQPLSMISLIASSLKLKNDMKQDDNSHEDLNNIIEYTRSLSKTIDYFHSSLSDEDKSETFSIKSLSTKLELLLEGVLRENNITFIVIHEDEDIKINTYMTKLITVLLSIITNAKEVLIQRNIENKIIEFKTSLDNDDLIIEILDNAGGIPEEIIHRIFEPYFTTQHNYVNKGLSLHLNYETIRTSLRGEILVENYSLGAKFIIKLPL